MYLIGLVEASIEPLPPKLQSTKKARVLSKRMGVEPKYIILDKSLFYKEMKANRIDGKRGRPDIVHMFLCSTQYSPLNKAGLLRVFIHTVNNEIIEVEPETRTPKNYYQFISLMQHLFRDGRVPPRGKPLIKLYKNTSLFKYLKKLGVSKTILLWEKGERVKPDFFLDKTYPTHAILVGGFPHGDFNSRIIKECNYRVSIYSGQPLDAWIVVDRIISFIEYNLKGLWG